MAEAKYSYGLHVGSGQLVHVDTVPRGRRCGCICPACEAPLVAKKGSVYQNHFAHETSSTACEGALHIIAKRLLAERIQRAINTQSTVPAHWECKVGTTHEADLLALSEIDAVSLERWWPQKGIRPDITLSIDGQPTMLLEVVVTHSPEYDTSRAGLPILELHLEDDSNLEALQGGTVPLARTHNLDCGCRPNLGTGGSLSACAKCGRASGPGDLYYSSYSCEYDLCSACLPSPKDMTHVCKACGSSFAAKRYDHDLCRDCWGKQSQREQWELWHCQRCRKRLNRPGYTYCWPCNKTVREEAHQRAQQAMAEEERHRQARKLQVEEELEREGADLNALVARLRHRAGQPLDRRTPEA